MSRLVHFEIHVGDETKAMAFYKAVFGWEFQQWPIPKPDGTSEIYWGIITGPKDVPGINGGLVKRRGPAPIEGAPVNSYLCTMVVEDVDSAVAKVLGAGGVIALAKFNIPGVGDMAYCKDIDGNIFGLHQIDPNAK